MKEHLTDLYNKDVFINCPYDQLYNDMFTALVFEVHALGFVPRCARESPEGSRPRLEEIRLIIAQCRYGIHDLSRNTYDSTSELPRLNVPFELGLFKECSAGEARENQKHCLILERNDKEYLRYISDLAGHDVLAHGSDVKTMVTIVRDWLRKASRIMVPGGESVWAKYLTFRDDLDELCQKLELGAKEELIFVDLSYLSKWWLDESENRTLATGDSIASSAG